MLLLNTVEELYFAVDAEQGARTKLEKENLRLRLLVEENGRLIKSLKERVAELDPATTVGAVKVFVWPANSLQWRAGERRAPGRRRRVRL